jgi:site-specific DNA-cytosine methylase
LPVTRYSYKPYTGIKLDKNVTGWLADDVEKVFPKAVQYNDETYPVLDEDDNKTYETIYEDGTEIVYDDIVVIDEDGNEAIVQQPREVTVSKPRQVEKTFVMENVKNITMTEALPTLWGAVQRLTQIVEEQNERIKELEGR